jgi:predicted transcriptional regulator
MDGVNPLSEMIRDTQVLDLGPLPAPRLAPSATVHQALQFLVRGRRGAIVVVEEMHPVGIFTERDVLHRLPEGLFTSREQRNRMPLRDVMSQPPVTVRRQETLAEAMEKMADKELRHLVVVDRNGDLKGLLTTNDLVQFLTDQFPEDTVNLPPRLHQLYRSPEGA